MSNEETDRITELRERVERLQEETRLTMADHREGLCNADDVAKAVDVWAEAMNDLQCEQLPVM